MIVTSVVGARPNFVKLAAVIDYFDEKFEHIVIHTGQHYDYEMSQAFFDRLELRDPDIYLGVGSGTQGYQLGELIKRAESHLMSIKPDLVVVYGDTNSTMGGALAAVKAGIPVAHVEAGLRSFDIKMQEEINRRVTDHISTFLFAPTPQSENNLRKERVLGKIFLTGDVHVDVLYKWIDEIKNSKITEELDLECSRYLVFTVHRAENVDNPNRLAKVVSGIRELSKFTKIVFPVHPRTFRALKNLGLMNTLTSLENLILTKPLDYIDFVGLLNCSSIVVTDSGGVQREAYLLGKPVIVLRDRTEWIELVQTGWVKLVDVDVDRLVMAYFDLQKRATQRPPPGILGDGRASERITSIIMNEFGHM